jgi:DNA polymerase-3 subunit gamma/tau
MCVAYSNNNVTYKSVLESIGLTDRETLKILTKAVLEGNEGDLLKTIDMVAKSGKNITQLSKDLVGYVRDLLVVKTCKDYAGVLKLPQEELKDLKAVADTTTSDKLIEMLNRLSRLDNEYRYSTNPRSLFEITTVSLCKFEMTELSELKMKVKLLESKLSKGN